MASGCPLKNAVEKMEVSDQDSPPGLNSTHRVFIEEPVGYLWDVSWGQSHGSSREDRCRGGLGRKHPFSPLLNSWCIIGQASASCQRPIHIVAPGVRGREVECGERRERVGETESQV